MKVLVTGGAGYIGSITSHELKKAGFEPVIFDSLEKGHPETVKDFKLIKGETHNWQLLAKVLKEEKIEAVLHFAAYIEMGESMQDPYKYFYNNTFGKHFYAFDFLDCCFVVINSQILNSGLKSEKLQNI